MSTPSDLDTLFSDAELPFGHPCANYDDSPADHDRFDDRYEPPPRDPPEKASSTTAPTTGRYAEANPTSPSTRTTPPR